MKFNVEIDGQSYEVEVKDIHARPVVAMVDGEKYEVWPEMEASTQSSTGTSVSAPLVSIPELAQASTPLGESPQGAKSQSVTAPLPGVIVAVLVKPGDVVSSGQELCTLEAMKMKNAIRANRDGKIASVEINVGDQVSHGQVMMTYAE